MEQIKETQERENGHTESFKPRKTPANTPNLVSALVEHNEALTAKLSLVEKEESAKHEKLLEMKSQLDDLIAKISEIDKESEELEESFNNKDEEDSTSFEIQTLLATYERLKSDEKVFKEMCNRELERLQNLAAQTHDTESPQSEVQAQFDRANNKVEAGRVELADLSRKLATLNRQIEQIPNRTELREYRLRFSELYNQVSATHRQTKQYFSLHNSLEDTKRYLEKELSLLNSIIDSYQQASSTPQGREQFLKQLATLHEGMKETCSKVDKRHQTERIGVGKLQQELQRLLDQKVAYEKCLKDLEAECRTNDQLLGLVKKNESVSATETVDSCD